MANTVFLTREERMRRKDLIRYQVVRPDVTTCAPCPTCGRSARGGATCADCLAANDPLLLAYLTDLRLARAASLLQQARDRGEG